MVASAIATDATISNTSLFATSTAFGSSVTVGAEVLINAKHPLKKVRVVVLVSSCHKEAIGKHSGRYSRIWMGRE
jgi:hypothetical protein